MKISIALATYEGERYIEALLSSLALQTLLPFELVVSDDNSLDNTVGIVLNFAKVAPFKVRVISNAKRGGVLENFAKAFNDCEGDLIAYCDQDDVWAPDKLKLLAACFENKDVKLAIHRSEVVDANLESLGYEIPEKHSNEYGEVPFPSSIDMTYGLGHQMLFDAKIYRDFAWIFSKNFAPLKSIAENYDIQLPFLAGLNGSIYNLEHALVKFRRHGAATSDAGLMDSKNATTSGFLSKSPAKYKQDASEFASLALLLETSIAPVMPEYQEKIRLYVHFMKLRSEILSLRGRIYQSTSLWQRQSAFWTLVYQRAYAKKIQRGFGHKALVVDAIVSLIGFHNAKRFVAVKSKYRLL